MFFFDDDITKPVFATGILLISEDSIGGKKVFVQYEKERNRYADFGGKVDDSDKNLDETAGRELGEETNFGIYEKNKNGKEYLDKKLLEKLINDNLIKKFYLHSPKYLLYIVGFDEKKYGMDFEKIGEMEELDKISRIVKWVTLKEFTDFYQSDYLHPRLWNRELLQYFGYSGEMKSSSLKPQTLKKFAFKSL